MKLKLDRYIGRRYNNIDERYIA